MMVGMYDCALSNTANFTRTSLLYAARCKAGDGTAVVIKVWNFYRSTVMPSASSPRVLNQMT